jgi:hypothetical protein
VDTHGGPALAGDLLPNDITRGRIEAEQRPAILDVGRSGINPRARKQHRETAHARSAIFGIRLCLLVGFGGREEDFVAPHNRLGPADAGDLLLPGDMLFGAPFDGELVVLGEAV